MRGVIARFGCLNGTSTDVIRVLSKYSGYSKPKSRYTFLDGDDLEDYLTDTNAIIKEYKNNFESISMTYMADEKYESNNIFYAVIKVQFHHFVNEEYFKVIAID